MSDAPKPSKVDEPLESTKRPKRGSRMIDSTGKSYVQKSSQQQNSLLIEEQPSETPAATPAAE